MKIDSFLIDENATLREALARVERNHHGMIVTSDASGRVTGVATDGDIRRQLLSGRSLDDQICTCINPDFIFDSPETPRETILKKLDQRIRFIPLLDANHRLVDVVSRDHFPVKSEQSIFARARSPVRISFGGGGSDLTHFFSGQNGAVINTTISLYSHATLRVREDEKISIHSLDLNDTLHAENLESALVQNDSFGLIKSLLKTVEPQFGFDLYLNSDFPMNSGLGGSAVVSAAVLGCFNQFRRDQWDRYELSELAFQAERVHLGIAGGWQDQYATVFGGFNFMEFRMDQNIVHPLRINPDVLLELEESLILCDTGTTHNSGDIHEDQRRKMAEKTTQFNVEANVELSYQIRNHLLRGNLLDFGRCLHKAWQFKRQFSDKISTAHLDRIYEHARAHGAIGGKLLGAGGGGFFLFYVPPFQKHRLIKHLKEFKLRVWPFRFDNEGLCAWSVREDTNHMEVESSLK